jgi:hypothetical protein
MSISIERHSTLSSAARKIGQMEFCNHSCNRRASLTVNSLLSSKKVSLNVKWSKECCFLEKVKSKTKINDHKADIYQRAPTFDGNNFNTTTHPILGEHLPYSLKKIVENFVQVTYQYFLQNSNFK